MSTIETDAEVVTRLEFEQTQRSEGWKLLRGMLRDQRRNLLIGALVGISWAGFKTAVPQMTKNAINQGIEKDGPLLKWVLIIAGLGVLTGVLSGMRRYIYSDTGPAAASPETELANKSQYSPQVDV